MREGEMGTNMYDYSRLDKITKDWKKKLDIECEPYDPKHYIDGGVRKAKKLIDSFEHKE